MNTYKIHILYVFYVLKLMKSKYNSIDSNVAKVTMNMSSKTLEDVEAISKIIGTNNRTSIVAKALGAYRRLLE